MTTKRGQKLKNYDVETLEGLDTSVDAYKRCPKQSSHKNYFTRTSFNLECLSQQFRDDDLLRFVTEVLWDLTVKLEVTKPHSSQITKSLGTGLIVAVNGNPRGDCSCSECKNSGRKTSNWAEVKISTAQCVVPTREDAENCMALLFYDNDNEDHPALDGVKTLHGNENEDWCLLVCATHDKELAEKLQSVCEQFWDLGALLAEKYEASVQQCVIIVSHPHGASKRISVGDVEKTTTVKEVRADQNFCQVTYTTTACKGTSGAFAYITGLWSSGLGFWFGHPFCHSGHNGEMSQGNSYINYSSHGVFSI